MYSPLAVVSIRRFSSAVEQRFCKPKVGSSILSTGTTTQASRHAVAYLRGGLPTSRQKALGPKVKTSGRALPEVSEVYKKAAAEFVGYLAHILDYAIT